MIEYRKASLTEINELKALLWKFGPNEWNYLTPEGVNDEFALIENGHAEAVVAVAQEEIIGLAVLIDGNVSPGYVEKYGQLTDMQFIGDVVVSSLHSGKGVATKLLQECLAEARAKGAKSVLIERHEENLGSAGMMRKAGFEVIDVFHDPKKRAAGSQNSVILRFNLEEK